MPSTRPKPRHRVVQMQMALDCHLRLSFVRFCRGRIVAFHGREEVLGRIKAYLEAPASAPLVSANSFPYFVLSICFVASSFYDSLVNLGRASHYYAVPRRSCMA